MMMVVEMMMVAVAKAAATAKVKVTPGFSIARSCRVVHPLRWMMMRCHCYFVDHRYFPYCDASPACATS